MIIGQDSKKLSPVLIIKKDISPLITAAGDMVQSKR